MAKVYDYKKPNDMVLNWCEQRRREIQTARDELIAEEKLINAIVAQFTPLVCARCQGEGIVMLCIEGCEMDGPRQHTCPKCHGTGKPPAAQSGSAGKGE
jgi:hypothetical protein